MSYKGVTKGKTIELEQPLPYPEGQPVSVFVEPLAEHSPAGSPTAIRQVMQEPPHLKWEDVGELERAIEEGRFPVDQGSVLNENGENGR